MFKERLHRTQKYSYLNKATNSCLDALVQALLDVVGDVVRNHGIMANNIKAGTSCKHHQILHDEQKVALDSMDECDVASAPSSPVSNISFNSDFNNNVTEGGSSAEKYRVSHVPDLGIPMFDMPVRGSSPASVKQMRKGGSRCQVESMLKRNELRAGKEKHGVPPIISKHIEGDDELNFAPYLIREHLLRIL
ncbi:hypothetical protein COOONC_20339 [Cooperia oncophora]